MASTTARSIVMTPLSEIKTAHLNPKRHASKEIKASMGRFGYTSPIEIDERTAKMVAGHGRLEALVALKEDGSKRPSGITAEGDEWLVPVVRGWASKNDEEAEAYIVASNRLTELGGWDDSELVGILDKLKDGSGLEGVGYSIEEAEQMAHLVSAHMRRNPTHDPDDIPSIEEAPQRAALGDIWRLGTHRVMVGDCRDEADVLKLMQDRTINLAITSPPYASQRKYDEATAFRPIPPEGYVEWFEPAQANVAKVLADDGSWFVNIKASTDGLDTDLYVLDLVSAHARQWGWHFATELCWERSGVPGRALRRFKNQFEPIYQFTRGEWKFRPNAVRHESSSVPVAGGPGVGSTTWSDRQGVTDIFDGRGHEEGLAYPGNRLPTFASSHQMTGHAAAFPIGLPAWFMRAYTDEGDAVYDPFMGSGSTLIAAEQENRTAFGMEISPRYVDIIIKRFEDHTGIEAIRETTQGDNT